MIRRLLVGLIALLCSAQFGSLNISIPEPVVTATASAPDARNLPMHFDWRREGPPEACGTQCRVWISAVGAITSDTVRDFDAFARDPNVRGATIVFDSEGGSVLSALSLGRSIRRLGMTTAVGRTLAVPSSEEDPRAKLVPEAYCESMCAFALLGGVRRYVPAEAHVLVHQIWLGDRRNDAMAATYSAEDLVLVQRDIGRLAQYTVEMGGDIDLLETALRIPPWEPMRALSRDEITHMKLSTVDKLFDEPAAEVVAHAAPATAAAASPVALRSAAVTARGWAVVDDAGTAVLARRHPLTVEGENIGQFDLVIGCGPTADAFAVTYIESRRSRETTRHPSRLKEVVLSIARNNLPLSLASSETRRMQVVSVARGMIPARLVSTLTESDARAVTVFTANQGSNRTTIRVGSSGFAQSFVQFAAGCGNGQRSRSAQAAIKQ